MDGEVLVTSMLSLDDDESHRWDAFCWWEMTRDVPMFRATNAAGRVDEE